MRLLLFAAALFFVSALPALGQALKPDEATLKEWGQTLSFGIDTEILEVVKKIRESEEQSLNPELLKILAKSVNPALRKAILEYFIAIKYGAAEEIAFTILGNHENEDNDLVRSIVNYLSEIKSPRSLPVILKLVDADENLLALSAIAAVGKMGDASQVAFFLKKLRDPDFKADRKPALITALGDLKALEAVSELIKIVENTDEEHIWRINACEALGKIKDAQAVPVMRKVFAENDPYLRASAAFALLNFDLPLVIDILIEGLKDSFWKVRVAACQGLARPGATQAIEILIYKVNKDPDMPVKIEAIKALGVIGTEQSFSFLRQIFEDRGKAFDVRQLAYGMLVEKNLSPPTVDAIERVVRVEWDSRDKTVLETVARKLMNTESPLIEKILALFLDNPDSLVRICGIRGIVKNRFSGLRGRLGELEKKDIVDDVRKEAHQALEKL